MNPQLSIITPVYNNRTGLRRCVASVAVQTDVVTEHIIVDGASRDGTVEWLASQSDARWISRPDGGMYDAINDGIAMSRAPLIHLLNADEQSLPGTLAFACRTLADHLSVDLLFGDYILVDPDGAPLASRREIPARRFYLRYGVNYVLTCAMVFRRDVYARVGPFDAGLRYLGDKDWLLKALEQNVVFCHARRDFSLFTIADGNLSRHPAAVREQARVRARHGAANAGLVRPVARLCRAAEKLVRGAYFPRTISYPYQDPPAPPRRFCARVAGRWRWMAGR